MKMKLWQIGFRVIKNKISLMQPQIVIIRKNDKTHHIWWNKLIFHMMMKIDKFMKI